MSQINQFLEGIPTYRAFGQPAYGYVQFKTVPSNGDTITINGDVYTYGTSFAGATTVVRGAQALTAAIRSDVGVQYLSSLKVPIRPYCAVWYNDTVVVFATQPGTGGNAITLAASNAASVNLSGATLAGGTNGSPIVTVNDSSTGTLTDASGTIATGGTSQVALAANTATKYLIIQNLSTDVLYVNFGAAATAGSGSLALAAATASPGSGGSIVFESTFIVTNSVNIIGATNGDKYTLKYA